jgi:hypothetical protein
VLPHLGDRTLSSIDRLTVRDWIAALSASGLAPATVRKAVFALRGMLDVAADAKLIVANPATRASLPETDPFEMRFLTRSSSRPSPRRTPNGGGRWCCSLGGAACAPASWPGCAAAASTCSARPSIAETAVEVGGTLRFGQPKTRASRRRVRLPRSVADALAAHLGRYVDDDPDALVFVGQRGRTAAAGRVAPARVAAGRRRGRSRAAALPRSAAHGGRAVDRRRGAPEGGDRAGGARVELVQMDRYGHLFPGSESSLNERLDAMFVAPPEPGEVVDLEARRGGRRSVGVPSPDGTPVREGPGEDGSGTSRRSASCATVHDHRRRACLALVKRRSWVRLPSPALAFPLAQTGVLPPVARSSALSAPSDPDFAALSAGER